MKKLILSILILTLVLLTSCTTENTNNTSSKSKAVVSPNLPVKAKIPSEEEYLKDSNKYEKEYAIWRAEKAEQSKYFVKDRSSYKNFATKLNTNILNLKEENTNVVYSPINMYLAIGLLGQLSDGNANKEILDAIGLKNKDAIADISGTLWNSNYTDDGRVKCLLANSIWLRDDFEYKKDTLNILADKYFASVFSGKMGSKEYDKVLQDWLNENTGNFLKDQVSQESFDPETTMALASTIYYKNSWLSPFSESETKPRDFHGLSKHSKVDFMNESSNMAYFESENFSMVNKYMSDGARMSFILPKEGLDTNDLLNDESFKRIMQDLPAEDEIRYIEVNFSLPKFDVNSRTDLTSILMELGIKDVFEPNKTPFPNIIENTRDSYLSEITHVARVKVDELGCEAAAYTLSKMEATAMPEEEVIDFVLDRPFIFTINSESNDLLFVGVVNDL